MAKTYLPKELLDKNLPAHVVAHYYNTDGSLRADPQAKYWKPWMKQTAQKEQGLSLPADVVKGTLDGFNAAEMVGKHVGDTPQPLA